MAFPVIAVLCSLLGASVAVPIPANAVLSMNGGVPDVTPNYTAVLYNGYSLKSATNDDLTYWTWSDQANARERVDETWLSDTSGPPATTQLGQCVPNPDKTSQYDKLIWRMTINWNKKAVSPSHRQPPQTANFTADMVESCTIFKSAPREFADCVDEFGWAPLEGRFGKIPYLGKAKCLDKPMLPGDDCVHYYSIWPDGQLCLHPDSGNFAYQITDQWGWVPNGFETHDWIRNDQLECQDNGNANSFTDYVPKTELPQSLVEDFITHIHDIGIKCKENTNVDMETMAQQRIGRRKPNVRNLGLSQSAKRPTS